MKRFLTPRYVVLVLIIAGLGVAFYGVNLPLRASAQKSSCQSNLKMIGLAAMQYARDYDEGFMLASTWKRGLAPYGKFYRKPDFEPVYICPTARREYAYNIHLDANYFELVSQAATLAMFYEPATSINADGGQQWAQQGVHGEGSNVGFVDGHVKWLKTKPVFWTPSLAQKAKVHSKRAVWWKNYFARQKRNQRSSNPNLTTR